MALDRGTDWVRRWFAKPLVTGSIPTPVSIFKPLYGQRMLGRGHRFQLGQAVARSVVRRLFSKTRGAFLEGFKQDLPRSQVKNPEEVADEIAQLTRIAMEHHAKHVELSTILSETRDKLIEARKELSRVKRAASPTPLPKPEN